MKRALGVTAFAAVAAATGYSIHSVINNQTTVPGTGTTSLQNAAPGTASLTHTSQVTNKVQSWRQQIQAEIQSLQQQVHAEESGQSSEPPESNSSSSYGWGVPQGGGSSPSGAYPGGSYPGGADPDGSSPGGAGGYPGMTGGQASVTLPQNAQASQNWAGYIDQPVGGAYTSVAGNWKVPGASGSASSSVAQWIGLGGVATQNLLQVGTLESVSDGQVSAQVFWEKLPSAAHKVMTVPVGSTVHAKIAKASGSTWDIQVTAVTPSGTPLQRTIPVPVAPAYAQGIGSSAEWITEDPSNQNNRLYPLADAGTITYTGATVDGTALDAAGNQLSAMAMVNRAGHVLIAPTAIGGNGHSFSTDTLSTASSPSLDQMGAFSSAYPNGSWGPGRVWGEHHGWREHRGWERY